MPLGVYQEPAPSSGPVHSIAITPVVGDITDYAMMSALRDVERLSRLRDRVSEILEP